MKTTTTGGLLLLLIGAVGLIGFLTGNLDRWLAWLFTPSGVPPTTAPATPSSTGNPVAIATGDRRSTA